MNLQIDAFVKMFLLRNHLILQSILENIESRFKINLGLNKCILAFMVNFLQLKKDKLSEKRLLIVITLLK